MNIQPERAVLVVSPHTDDGELGCGGTLAKFVEQGRVLHYVAFSAAEESVPPGFPRDALRTEVLEATQALKIPPDNVHVLKFPVRRLHEHRQEILDYLVNIRDEIKPDLVLGPSSHDLHQDHQIVAAEVLRAFKTIRMAAFELPWNHIRFDAVAFASLDDSHVQSKIRALRCYKTQAERPYFDPELVTSWARMRGMQIGVKYAECFEIIRWRL